MRSNREDNYFWVPVLPSSKYEELDQNYFFFFFLLFFVVAYVDEKRAF